MTKYILGGGYESKTGDAKAFCRAIAEGAKPPLRILDCFFAEPPDTWQEKFNRKAKKFFAQNMPVAFECQLAHPKTFATQSEWADVIYLHGGDALTLAKFLEPFDLKAIWKGKTIVGTSAGAMFLSACSWGCDRRQVYPGYGLVNVGVIVHYRSDYGNDSPAGPIDWDKADQEMAQQCGNIPVHGLKEGEFVVIQDDNNSH